MKSVDSDRFNKAEDSLASFLESPIFRLNLMDDEFAGKTIDDRYIVEKELGRTPMSQVYLARDRRLQQQPVHGRSMAHVPQPAQPMQRNATE